MTFGERRMDRMKWLALAAGVSAALLVYYFLAEREQALRAASSPIQVLVAKQTLGRGTRVSAENVSLAALPGAYVMPGAIAAPTRAEVIKLWQDSKNQFALVPILRGEQILFNKLTRLSPGFAGLIPEGQRAVSLALEPAAGLAGHLKPGQRVDVMGVFSHQFQNQHRTTAVVLVQNALVVAVGEETLAGAEAANGGKFPAGPGNGRGTVLVSLAAGAEDAVRLALAAREGELQLALRSPGDDQQLDFADQNLGSLLGPLLKVRKEEIQSTGRRVEIIRGTQ